MKNKIIPLFLVFLSFGMLAQNNVFSKKPLTIGEIVELKSTVLNENRILNIYLPLEYDKNLEKKYPVIYVLDGTINEDFLHIVGLTQFASFSWINIMPESIVVGIANVDRKRDFTFPTTIKKDKKDFPTTGSSAKFINFLKNEVQPFITKNYQISAVKTIIGQSLGGLLATEILFKNPDLFDNYVIVSPSLWWDNQSLLQLNPVTYTTKKSIFVAVGKEGKIMERDAKNLYKKLKKDNNTSTKVYFEFFENQDHGDVLHLASYNAFVKVFKKKK